MSPPAVNARPAPRRTIAARRRPVRALEELAEPVARGHRDAVQLLRDVEGDRRDPALLVAVEPQSVLIGHALTSSSRSSRRRIFPAALLGSTSTKRYSRGRLKRASEDARQYASSLVRGRGADDDRDDALPQALVRRPHDRDLADTGTPRQHVLHLERVDVLAARDDHVVDPSVDPEVAVLVQVARVARVVPAVADRLRVGVRRFQYRRTPRRSRGRPRSRRPRRRGGAC